MTEPTERWSDELDRLRRANPVPDPRLAFPSDHPAAQALLEEMIVPDTAVHPANPHPSPSPRPPQRRRRLLALVAAAAVVVVGVAAVAAFDDNDSEPLAGPAPDRRPISVGSASCVELYSLETLPRRQLAFDGTVETVEGDRVTFRVEKWYRGGDGETVTLAGASTLAGLTSAGPTLPVEPGTRLLVAGDGGFAWSCGFTQPYNPEVARAWSDALS